MISSPHQSGMAARPQSAKLLLSQDGCIVYCSGGTLAALGIDGIPAVHRKCSDFLQCVHRPGEDCVLEKARKSRRRETGTIEIGDRHCEEAAEPMLDQAGEIAGYLLSITAPSPSAKPNLIRLQRLETIAQAAGGVVHDLNNIFTRIAGAIWILNGKIAQDTVDLKNDPMLTDIGTAARQGAALTSQLLQLGKGGIPEKTTVVLADVIRRAVVFSSMDSPVQPIVSVQKDLWAVQANVEQVEQLIGNLVTNALESLGGGKSVRVSAENVTEQASSGLGLGRQRHVRITVRDDGCGIPAEDINRIFEPFFTTKKDGTGLGLALAALIVTEYSGRITVESELQRGTTFTVHLPAAGGQSRTHALEGCLQCSGR